MDFTDLPSYQLIGETTAGYYYVCFATDMQGYTDDADALNEFRTLSDGVNQVVSTIRIRMNIKNRPETIYRSAALPTIFSQTARKP